MQQEGAAAVDQTIGYGQCKIVDILGLRVMDDVRHRSPADTKLDRGRVGGSLGKGLGVLLPGVTAFFLAKDVFGQDDGNRAIVDGNFGDCGVFLTPGSARLAIPASQWHGLVLPPCHCEAGIASNM